MRAAVKNLSLYLRNHHLNRTIFLSPKPTNLINLNVLRPISLSSSISFLRFFSSENHSSHQNPNPNPKPEPEPDSSSSSSSTLANLELKESTLQFQDVDNKELKSRIEKYFKGDEEALPAIVEAIIQRKLSGKHEETDDELNEELRFAPLNDVQDAEFEDDFEDAYETDDEIDNLYNARDIVSKRMLKDEYFNMDDKKWDGIVREAMEKGYLRDMRECEGILEDMLHWDKLLPDDIKVKVSAKIDELGNQIENQGLEAEEAYKQYQEFEDEIVKDSIKKMEEEGPQKEDEVAEPKERTRCDDPPGVGPVLRWQTRVVFTPGGDAWHPKNRKVKLSVTVKELGLSKYQFRRLREIVGKRYHPGKDELTIISERFEHREENRKDCLRTLLNIIEEAGKANAMVEDVRKTYVKERLKANPAFMARLLAKKQQSASSIST